MLMEANEENKRDIESRIDILIADAKRLSQDLMQIMDKDGDQKINREEFLTGAGSELKVVRGVGRGGRLVEYANG
jgi:hypothetical protein